MVWADQLAAMMRPCSASPSCGQDENLVAGGRGADQAPAVADPGGEEGQPAGEDTLGLEGHAGGGGDGLTEVTVAKRGVPLA